MSASRGGILVGVAIVVGILIFSVINRGGSPDVEPTATTRPPTVATTPATNPDGSTATTIAGTTATTKAKKNSSKTARTNDQVVVQVLNGSAVPGAATQRSNDLKAKGYQIVPAGNVAARTGSGVECVAGYEKEAVVLVTTLKSLGVLAAVEPIAEPLPAGFDAAANCYVILGK
ncbi:MAG: LytR C-terminal domain-containing protein [Actinomycetota bacterium]